MDNFKFTLMLCIIILTMFAYLYTAIMLATSF